MVSERRACFVLILNRQTKRHKSVRQNDIFLRHRIFQLSEKHPRYGYRKIFDLLKGNGLPVSRERVRLIRKQEGLQVLKKQKKKRRHGKSTRELCQAKHPNHVWSYDFVSDQTADGRRIRCLTIIDEYTRYCLSIHVGRSITAKQVKSVLQELFVCWGKPDSIKSDNGPEFVANEIQNWLKRSGIGIQYIDPGSPWQNCFNESFNSVFRDGCLDRWLFYTVQEARRIIEQWAMEYNHIRPHGSLMGKTPARYLEECEEKVQKAA
jgi:transposase InsO family protein